jgi:hypothetical protein
VKLADEWPSHAEIAGDHGGTGCHRVTSMPREAVV